MCDYYNKPEIEASLGLSDHQVVICSPKPSFSAPIARKEKRKMRCFSENAKALFGYELREINWTSIFRAPSCHEKYVIFENLLSSLIEKHFPFRFVTRVESERPWITDHFRELISKRQRALYTRLYDLLRNKVNRMRKILRKQYYQRLVNQVNDNNRHNWWEEVKNLTGQKASYDPLSNLINGIAEGDKAVLADMINSFFVSVSEDLQPLQPRDTSSQQEENISPAAYIIPAYDVERKLRSIDVRKAPGPDGIPSWILKDFSSILAEPVCSIFNSSIAEGYVPTIWKSADIIPIPKVNPPVSIESDLRPISLTPVLAKILESYVCKWIWDTYLPKADPNQYGNIPGSSTVFALIDLINNWTFETDAKNNAVRVLLIDYKKAFDRINHSLLLTKLKNLEVDSVPVDWIRAFLCMRQQRVKISQVSSDWRNVHGGVPQGTKTGPLLFVIMITDLCSHLPLVKYVDDTTMYEVCPKGKDCSIQNALNELVAWSNSNDMQINPTKTKEMVICFTKDNIELPLLTIAGNLVERVKEAKLLGLYVNNKLNWDTHVKETYTKAAKRLYLLVQLRRAGLSQVDMCRYYVACIRSVLEYACQVFHGALTKEQANILESIQKRALRIITPGLSYDDAISCLNLELLSDRRRKLCLKLFTQIQNPGHKLNCLLPVKKESRYSLRNRKDLCLPKCKTNRYKNSYIPWCLFNLQ